jgi:predicted ferric reductase
MAVKHARLKQGAASDASASLDVAVHLWQRISRVVEQRTIMAVCLNLCGVIGVGIALAAAAWDVVRPCKFCRCYECADLLNKACDVWSAQEEIWSKEWWPLVWMGGLTFVVLVFPHTVSVSKRTLELCWHTVNVAWLLLACLPFAWRDVRPGVECGPRPWAYLGVDFAKMCGINMCILLASVSRSSAWLKSFGAGYTDSITIHRVAGWWCLLHVILHVLAFLVYYYFTLGWAKMYQKFTPMSIGARMNIRGMVNVYGALATIAALALGIFALRPVRRKFYGLFYDVHVGTALIFILFGALHDSFLVLYLVPACAYFIDRMCALGVVWKRHEARLIPLTTDCVRLSLPLGTFPNPPALQPGTRWLYLKIPSMSREWHPFSITGPCSGADLYIKASGDWSRSLCAYGQSCRTVNVRVDGPYGVAPLRCPFGSTSSNSSCPYLSSHKTALLLIGGGVGIVPWADMIAEGARPLSYWSSVTVVWVMMGEAEYDAVDSYLQLQTMRDREVEIQVYITGRFADTTEIPTICPLPIDPYVPEQSSIGALLRTRFVMALLPAIVLYVAILMRRKVREACSNWTWGVFSYSLARNGGFLAVVLAAMVTAAACLAVCLYVLQQGSSRGVRCLKAANDSSEQPRDFTKCMPPAEDGRDHRYSVSRGRPDFKQIISGFAEESALSVKVCGPRPMLDATRRAVAEATSSGRNVSLHIEEGAEW